MQNHKDFTIHFKKTITELFNEVRGIVKGNSKIIKITKDSNLQIFIDDIDETSSFNFKIIDVRNKNGKYEFSVEYAPASTKSNHLAKSTYGRDDLIRYLNSWVKKVQLHNEHEGFHPEEKIFKRNQQEFFDNFKLLDDDADESTFTTDKQVIIYKYLEHTKKVLLENNTATSRTLIDEAEKIQDELGSSTKNEIIFRLSKLYARTKIVSFKVFMAIMKRAQEFGYNEMFKQIIELS